MTVNQPLGETSGSCCRNNHLGEIKELDAKTVNNREYVKIPKEEEWRIHVIRELIDVRQGTKSIPGLVYNEIKDILTFAAVS